MTVSARTLKFADGDRYLLATDGIRDMLPDDYIQGVMREDLHPQVAADRLVDAAIKAGGLDNATCVVVRFGKCPPAPKPPEPVDEYDDI